MLWTAAEDVSSRYFSNVLFKAAKESLFLYHDHSNFTALLFTSCYDPVLENTTLMWYKKSGQYQSTDVYRQFCQSHGSLGSVLEDYC